MLIFGTRPEAIKMVPLILAMQQIPGDCQTMVCVTGQLREMLDQVLTLFKIIPDFALAIMKHGQDLYDITAKILLKLRAILQPEAPDTVFIHGNTTTSMAAFYQQIPLGHIEAGLLTNDIYNQWPDEINRQLTGRLATYHFASTFLSRRNLLAENVNEDRSVVIGTDFDKIVQEVSTLLEDKKYYNSMSKANNPYIDGFACQRMVRYLQKHLIRQEQQ